MFKSFKSIFSEPVGSCPVSESVNVLNSLNILNHLNAFIHSLSSLSACRK